MDGSSDTKDLSQCVRVAVNIRPLVTPELLVGCTDCITVVPGEQQVQIGPHTFTYDYVYGGSASSSNHIFDQCVAPIVEALFHGYNGTVLAYGQTGSGKTYTMGTKSNGEDHAEGIIPKVMESIFSRVEESKGSVEYLIRVSFIEIFKEDVFDLLDPNPPALSRVDWSLAKPSGPARVPIQIRETINGGITLAGVTEAEVRTKEEMASILLRGSLCRATASTNMNSQSSRSHAIFTISLEQKKIISCPAKSTHDEGSDDILIAKLHLVDLAGSERAKRTGADGLRLREGIQINKGLLALGNVISALGDEKKRKEGGHVPYRDSKLTRLLQDSLGGNSKTIMIACVSPADTNAEETLNTLKYANRARNIQNKAIINRDPVAAQMQRMRSQIEELQSELLLFRGDSSEEELQILKHKISLLEASNRELQRELQDRKVACEHFTKRAVDAQIEKDKLIMIIESARNGKTWDEIDSSSDQELDLLNSYVSKIQELEGELLRLQNSNSLKKIKNSEFVGHHLGVDDESLHSDLSLGCDGKDDDIGDEAVVEVKELEHSSAQEMLDRELKELDKRLEQKEAEMKRFAAGDTSVLKQHFEKKVHELEHEKRTLQKEIEELKNKLANISSNSDEGAKKLKGDYLQKLNSLESQVAQLKKKQEAQAQLLKQKQKSDEAAKRLQDEIQRIKTQKVQLQQKIKQESEQFRLWKASREKEVLQLKKEGRRTEYEMHKLLALNQRQKMVLQRKTEEAAVASKRLKEVLARKAPSGAGNANAPTIQALMQAIEHELEVASRVHEVRSKYERQMQERAKMAKEVAQLKEEAQTLKQMNLSGSPITMSPGGRSSRLFALENMLATSSSSIVSMASHLSEAEERERAFTGRGRWNQVHSLVEAKNVMNHLFNLASTSRCHLWDKEVLCREKDLEIKELKEKVVHLVRQVEMQKAALEHQEKLHRLSAKKQAKDNSVESGNSGLNNGEVHQLEQKGLRSSMFFSNAVDIIQIEDMDTSDSDNDSDNDWVLDDQDIADESEWEASRRRRRSKKNNPKTDKYSSSLKQLSVNCENESVNKEPNGEELIGEIQKNDSGVCCTCSRGSLCKTKKCECRANGGNCSIMCSCSSSKCSNREQNECNTSQTLASQGALLLQSALSQKPIEINNENEPRRKALSDIGNSLVKCNALNPSQRKKWKKSVIQLVPTTPLPEPETTEPQMKPENPKIETQIPSQLPRAMRSIATDNYLLRERNNEHQADVAVNKEARTPTSPRREGKIIEEKENKCL